MSKYESSNMKLNVDCCYVKHSLDRIYQGDIFRDVKYFLWIDIKEDVIEGDEISVPYLVVLTQECDLEQDYENRLETENANTTNDKYLQSILVSPAYLAEKLRKGTHLEALELNMQSIDSKRWKNVINNQNSRYHYLPANEKFKIPELVIDFKHYYTLPRDFFYQYLDKNYIGTVDQLFRESLSQRFSYYLSRIGLPLLKKEM